MKRYITTTLPYVNSDPHIGFAMEVIRADVMARFFNMIGDEVFLNTGTDEHGIKIYRKASEKGIDTKAYVDEYASKFKNLKDLLLLSPDINFIRTTDENHKRSAQEFWNRCKSAGYIYKKSYQTKYCVGCELEKTDSELEGGKCPVHPSLAIELIDEENYFFKFSSFQDKLISFYESHPDFVIPEERFKEIKSFASRGLNDFSISRLKTKMPWGIEVPDDNDHVMYVWFDALVNYVSAIGWPDDIEKFNKWAVETGGMIQYCGKDNLRQQSAMWQAMLMSVGLPNSSRIIINGFVTGEGGVKMSKSLGNTIDPKEVVEKYDAEALRLFVSKEIHPFEDSPFTWNRFKESYNAYLANGLGNLISRVTKMASMINFKVDNVDFVIENFKNDTEWREYCKFMNNFNIQNAMNLVWQKISKADEYIQINQPFKLIKVGDEKAKEYIRNLMNDLIQISFLIKPVMPETSIKIINLVKDGKIPESPLFIRKE